MRIVGVDKVPMTPFDRGDDARKPVLTPIQLPHPPRQARARGTRHGGSRDVVVHLEAGGRIVRRRAGRARARQSHCVRSLRHAAEPAAGPDRGRAGQCQSRLVRRRTVRGRPGVPRRQARGPVGRRFRRAPRLCLGQRPRTALVRLGDGRCARRQGRCIRGAGRSRRADAGAADRARRRELAASRPLRHHPDRSAERARLFRRVASADAGSNSAPTARLSRSR